ncbi:unnamed protein product [Hymenolepis diminuta]|uniref:Not1 domain-containing protein n=1 Tax=Hymenolepis diminuta TaxID=6216 RepID=A0A0R3SHE7_HYMDI|nr:unnamed protein product [Hymenolepis diminuta]
MFAELKAEIIEPEKDSKICSVVQTSYIGFDGGLNIAGQSLMPRRQESPSQDALIPLQTPTARETVPLDDQTIGHQMEQKMPAKMSQDTAPRFSVHLPTQSTSFPSSNPMQQPSMQSSQFQQPTQSDYQQTPPTNADDNQLREIAMDEITDTLNVQEMLKAFESQRSSSSPQMDPLSFNKAIKFLSDSNAKYLISGAIISSLYEAMKIEQENSTISSIINYVSNTVYNRCMMNGISEDLFRVVEDLTIEITSPYVKKRLEETYSKLLENHMIKMLHSVDLNGTFLGEAFAKLVRMQIYRKVYSFFFSLIGREVLSVVKKELLSLLSRNRQMSQSYSYIAGTFQPSSDTNGNFQRIEMPQKMFIQQIAPSVFQRQQMAHTYPNSPQMGNIYNMLVEVSGKPSTSDQYADPQDRSQRNVMGFIQYQTQLVCSKLIDFVNGIISVTSAGPSLIMLETIKRYATNAVTSVSCANKSTWSSIAACVTNSFMKNYATSKDDAANEVIKRIHLDTLKLMCNLSSDEFIQSAVLSAWYEGVELERKKKEIGTSEASIWNWKAFAELLRQNLVDLEILDRFLSEIIDSNSSECVEFLLDLLDAFILPTLCGSTHCDILGVKLGEMDKNCTEIVSTEFGSIKIVAHNRAFMVLNEFDLWKSIRSFEKHQKSIPVTVDSIRIHTSYARIQALMDWGLLESKDVQKNFSIDNVEYQALFKEFSKPQIRNKWSEDKMKLHSIFNTWYDFCKNHPTSKTPDCTTDFLKTVFKNGTAENTEDVTHFFRALISEIVDNFTVGESRKPKPLRLKGQKELESRLEAFGEFLGFNILTASNIHENVKQLTLLCQFLGVMGRKTIFLHEESKEEFNPLPVKYILIKLFKTLLKTQEDSTFGSTFIDHVPIAFGYFLHLLRPSRVPAFQVVFLEILEDDVFIKRMLDIAIPAYHNVYAQLLVDVTKHVNVLAQSLVTHNSLTNLYQSLYDLWNKLSCLYPTFICEFAHYFSNFISIPLFSLRNLVISARYDQTSLSWVLDTDALERRLDLLPDPTGYVMDAGNRLPPPLKSAVESYISLGTPINFLEDLPHMFQARDSIAHLFQSPTKMMVIAAKLRSKALFDKALYYAAVNSQNVADYGFTNSVPYIPEMVSDFLVYLCIISVENCQYLGDYVGEGLMTRLPFIPIAKSLLKGMGNAGQYFIISCMVSHLRYLNKHTKFFAQCLLHIFKLASEDGNLRVVKNIFVIYIPDPQTVPETVFSESSDSSKTLTPNEEKRE